MPTRPQPRRRRRDAAAIASVSSVEPAAAAAGAPLPGASADAIFGILALAAAGCGSATVFLAELLAGKMLLPHFGGSPATWIVCLAFFQVTLVAAYAFANVLAVRARPGRQIVVQAALFGAAIVAMLVGTGGPAAGRFADVGLVRFPGLAVAAELATLVGLPFFAVASLGPLLAHWRCHWGGAGPGHDGSAPDGPASDGLAAYRLSVAGNAGSAAVLLAYPFFIETLAGIGQQRELLLRLVCISGGLALACGWYAARARRLGTSQPDGTAAAADPAAAAPAQPLPWRRRGRWMLWAAIPASWLSGVTAHATVEVAPIPLLWILPLAAYLASLAIVFAPGGRRWARFDPWLLAVSVLVPIGLLAADMTTPARIVMPLHMLAFFGGCLAIHGMLFDDRPGPRDLTGFYLALAIGGACGGLFNAVVAPLVFNARHEFPLALLASAWLLPPLRISGGRTVTYFVPHFVPCLVLAAILAAGAFRADLQDDIIHRTRTFFGVLTVSEEANGPSRSLQHGDVVHGVQLVSDDPARRLMPLTYYQEAGPLGSIVAACRATGPLDRVGIAGLGIGTIAAYGEPGEEFTFFEIDPAVVRIAEERRWFTFLADSRATTRIVVGDARLELAREPDASFDLLVIDAFTGDSVPTHLLTREALALYDRKLRPGGCLALHITNRYLNFAPAVAALAADGKWLALVGRDTRVPPDYARTPSTWAVLGRDERRMATIAANPTSELYDWQPLRGAPARVWTDDRSALSEALAGWLPWLLGWQRPTSR
jgi:SAM-dependent methyltransferase